MSKQILLALLGTAVTAMLLTSERGQGHPINTGGSTGDPIDRARPNVLYLTHSAGFKHQVLPLSQKIFKEIGEQTHAFELTATDDCSVLSREGLKRYDAVVFYTTGELPISDEQKAAFLDFIRSGKGFVGIHSATDTFYKWPE
ncbi:MAG TPA: ThuA domain-containing protein, partial [Blastocatellia bacterium]|nr:ThuA domain-containing protein [Blastocatellia bacterium]